ncbi:hypothetical protein F2Q69_00049679 [Brassica cretica]|uniref:Uncharacterized protein n=1 Tax=Brassica cretica TaxID=69181 RepID=A0A8S9PXJ2_BRACR|nr:hypothetical protein F2Q69_00049679 [Brassica cretica]
MGAKKGEIIYIVYRRRNRASVDQPPCREDAEDCTSSAGNLKTSPSPRGPAELRVVPSRFNDSVVDAQTSQGRVEGLWKSSQYCGICKRSWHSSDGLQKKVTETELADEITVVCNGMEGAYIRKFHVIECKCGSCGAKKQSPCEWEQHTGCRAKKWKYSVKVKGTMLTLEKWDIRSGDDALFAGR